MARATVLSGSLRKTAIIIAGTHRSGTSALTRVLSILGCDLPKTLLAASGSNETGFWESTLINRLNDDILGEFGQRWFDLADIAREPALERLAPFRQRALELLHDEFGDADLLLVKDPRICRLMPFWLEVLTAFEAKPVAVLPIRNPLEVAASLLKRNGIEPVVSHFIWLRHVLDAEAGSRPIPRIFMRYEALVQDWRAVVDRTASELGLAWPNFTPAAQAEIDSFLSSSLRHHVEPPESVMRDPGVPGWVRGAFGVVDQWAQTGEEPAGCDVLDRIRNDLDATGFQFDGLFDLAKSNRLKLRQLSKQVEDAASALSSSQAQAKADTLQIEALKSRLSKVTRDLTARLADATVDAAQLQALQEKLHEVSAKAAHRDTVARVHEAEVASLRSQIADHVVGTAERNARIAGLEAGTRIHEAEVASLRSQIADHVAGIAKRDARIAGLEARLARKQQDVAARGEQVAKIEARAKDLVAELRKLRGELGERSRLLAQSSVRVKRLDATAQRLEAENSRLNGVLADARREFGAENDRLRGALADARRALGEKVDRLAVAEQRLDRSFWRRVAGALASLAGGRRGEAPLASFLAASDLFDGDWYRSRYPDVAQGRVDPATHYFAHGAAEGRDPGPRFSTSGYLAANPDVAAAGVNPLVHYLKFGRAEGRTFASVSDGLASAGGVTPTVHASSDEAPVAGRGAAGVVTAGVKRPAPTRSEEARPRPQAPRAKPEGARPAPGAAAVNAPGAQQPAPTRSEADLVALVAAAPLFDRAWYLTQYPEVAESGTDPATHYVTHGAAGEHDPGPDFSSSWYLERHPHVAQAGTNPLVHYLLHGRANGRPIAPSARRSTAGAGKIGSGEFEGGQPPSSSRPPAAEPSSFLEPPAAEGIWVRQADLEREPGDHPLRLGGLVLARAAAAQAGAEPGFERAAADGLDLFCRLIGLDAHRPERGDADGSAAGRDGTSTSAAVRGAVSLRVPAIHAQVTDIWFLSDRDLRLRISRQIEHDDRRFVVRFYQSDLSGQRIVCAGEGPVDGVETSFVDASLVNPYLPLLVAFTTPDGRLLAVSVLPFPSLCRGGAHYAELCAVAQAPSLAEDLTAYSAALVDALLAPLDPSLAHVEVDLTDATGAERIFSTQAREWLAVMGVGLSPAAPAEAMDAMVQAYLQESLAVPDIVGAVHEARIASRKAAGTAVLALPAGALPSMRALTARDGGLSVQKEPTAGSFVVASSDLADPQWAIAMPPLGDVLLRSQPARMGTRFPVLRPIDGRDGRASDTVDPAVAVAVQFHGIARVAEASLLMPVAPDAEGPIIPMPASRPEQRAGSITVLLPSCGDGGAGLDAFLASLRLQTIVDHVTVVALADAAKPEERDAAERLLHRYFEGRHRLLDHRDAGLDARLDAAAAEAGGELLLAASVGLVLHDHRTLEALAALALREGVASAGCMLLGTDATKKKPALEVHSLGHLVDARSTPPHLHTIVRGDAHPALAGATFPVAANTPRLAMLRTSLWRELGGFADEGADDSGRIGYWRRALRRGFVHLGTSAVSATIDNEPVRTSLDDDAPRWTAEDDEWPAVASRAASLKRLRG